MLRWVGATIKTCVFKTVGSTQVVGVSSYELELPGSGTIFLMYKHKRKQFRDQMFQSNYQTFFANTAERKKIISEKVFLHSYLFLFLGLLR